MQSQKLPVKNKANNTLFMESNNLLNLSLNKPQNTKYIKSLGLLASISSLGLTVSLTQPVQASTVVLNNQDLTTVSQLPSFDIATATTESTSKNLIQTSKQIPQLPSLKVAQVAKATQKFYTVKSGDTITSIARQHGISSNQIIRANQLTDPNFIKINHQLVIPNLEAAKTSYSQVEVLTKPSIKNSQKSVQDEMLLADATALDGSFSSLVEKKAESRGKKVTVEIPIENSTEEKAQITDNTQEPYISKLRQDIVKLRHKYQQQSGNDETAAVKKPAASTEKAVVEATSKVDTLPAREVVEKQIAPSEIQQAIAPDMVAVETFNSLVGISKTNIDIPNLPPLASPEEYLPDNPVFNGYIWPAKGTLTSGYGWRWGRMHKGIDIAAPIGTPIMAAASGEVVFSGWNSGGYGNLVKLKHHDGSITFYAHNHRVLVNKGQRVKQGQLIAEMGSTGRSTGPHLHFEIRPNGSTAINPIARLPRSK